MKARVPPIFLFCACFSTLAAAPAAAETLRVPQDFGSIQQAVDAAAPGDRVLVAKGTYVENVVLSGKTDIRLRGNKSKAVVGGPGLGPSLRIEDCTGVDVRGLSFAGGLGPGGYGVRVEDSAGVTLSRCTVEKNTAGGIVVETSQDVTLVRNTVAANLGDGIRLLETTGATLTKNAVVANQGRGIHVLGALGVQLDALVQKNVVDTALDDGIRVVGVGVRVERNLVGTSGGGGVVVDEDPLFPSTGVRVFRNTVLVSGMHGVALAGSGNSAVKNRITDSIGSGLLLAGEGGHAVSKNIVVTAAKGVDLQPGCDGNQVNGNIVVTTDLNGYSVDSTGNLLMGNKSKWATHNGFEVNGTANTFIGNRSSKSGDFDLEDNGGGNSFTNNKFPTISSGG